MTATKKRMTLGRRYTPPIPRWSPVTATAHPAGTSNAITPATAVSGSTTTCWSAAWHRTTAPTPSGLKLVFNSWYAANISNVAYGEVLLTNAVTIKVWVQTNDGVRTRVTFGGQDSYTFDPSQNHPDGSGLKNVYVVSDVVSKFLRSGETFLVIVEQSVADSSYMIIGGLRLLSGATADGYTTLGEGTGAGAFDPDNTVIVGGSPPNGYTCSAVLTYGTHKSCALVGDSIFNGTGCSGIRGGMDGPGYRSLTRQLANAFDPLIKSDIGIGPIVTKGGETLAQAVTDATFQYRRKLILLCNPMALFTNYGTNDVGVSTTAQIKSNTLLLIKTFADAGIQVLWTPQFPRTSDTTTGWTTVAGQTPQDNGTGTRAELLRWFTSGDCKNDARANGTPSYMFRMCNIRAGIACNSSGDPDPLGMYLIPGTITYSDSTGTITSTTQLSNFTFQSDRASTNNIWRGYAIQMTSGTKNLEIATIRMNRASKGYFSFNPGLSGAPSVGDSFAIRNLPCVDGIHLSDEGARQCAALFSITWVRGTAYPADPQAPSGPPTYSFDPYSESSFFLYDVRRTDTLFKNADLTSAVTAGGDTVKSVAGLNSSGSARNLSDSVGCIYREVDTTTGQPYLEFNGSTMRLRFPGGTGSSSLATPMWIMIVYQQIAWQASAVIFSGNNGTTHRVFVSNLSSGSSLTINAGSAATIGSYANTNLVRMLIYISNTGSGSFVYVNGTKISVSPGTQDLDGLTIAAAHNSSITSPSNLKLFFFGGFNSSLTAAKELGSTQYMDTNWPSG